MHQDRIRWLFRRLGAVQRAALKPFTGIAKSVLIGDFGNAQALNANPQTGFVHHGEHGGKTAMRFADQPARRIIEGHGAGRAGLDTHFVLKARTGDSVSCARITCGIGQEFRHYKKADAASPGRCIRQFRQNQMDNVRRQVMLASTDEYLGPADAIAAIRLRHSPGPDQTQIGPALRLGQAHGARPLTTRQLR